ncbi:MAG: hypothetical protein HY695_09055 [Deltaproteobacteria bacterium]|nr:hypothetical protein [Deltaproteobacteria bacterium]
MPALAAGFLFLAVNSFYLLFFVGANFFYFANVLLHLVVGVLLILPLFFWGIDLFRAAPKGPGLLLCRLSFIVILAGIGTGIALAIFGGLRAYHWLMDTHMSLVIAGVILFAFGQGTPYLPRKTGWGPDRGRVFRVAVLTALLLPVALWLTRAASNISGPTIENPNTPPLSMEEEAMEGKNGPFFPSSVATSTKGLIPSSFFTESQRASRTQRSANAGTIMASDFSCRAISERPRAHS